MTLGSLPKVIFIQRKLAFIAQHKRVTDKRSHRDKHTLQLNSYINAPFPKEERFICLNLICYALTSKESSLTCLVTENSIEAVAEANVTVTFFPFTETV